MLQEVVPKALEKVIYGQMEEQKTSGSNTLTV